MRRYLSNLFTPVKTTLAYTLKSVEGALIFQITEQSADITAFLAKNSYRASNGLKISASEFPEFKDSKNTIFLRGTDASKDFKLDVTRFVSNNVRDSKKEMVNAALREFVDFIKKQAPAVSYAPKYQEADAYLVVLG